MSGYKYYFLEAEDFQGIKHTVVNIDGRSAFVMGPNGSGKSSFLNALRSPIDSSFAPSEPINNTSGEKRGIIRLKVGNPEVMYDIAIVYKPGDRTGEASLMENGQPVTKAVKTKIKQIMGDISFNVREFLEQSFTEKVKTLKRLTGREVELNALEAERAEAQKEVDYLRQSVDELDAVLKTDNRPFKDEDIATYEHPVDIEAINKEITDLSPALNKWNKSDAEVSAIRNEIKRKQEEEKPRLVKEHQKAMAEVVRVKELLKAAERAEAEADTAVHNCELETGNLQSRVANGERWLKDNPKPDLSEINGRLANANAHNQMHAIIKDYQAKHATVMGKRKQLLAAQETVKAVNEKKQKVFATSQLPVEGFSFDDKNIYLDGLPFEEGQINTARIDEVGVQIARAMNPNLNVAFIPNGSLMDNASKARVIEYCNKNDVQWFMEVVDDSNEMTIKFQEEER